LTKTTYYGQKSYLKLTLCPDHGKCDRDWNYYPREAGPVSVYGRGQCVNWTIAALNPERTAWILPETTGRDHCG
jgi:hypothetical protein